ncbi:MAG TPA: UDP-3-O-acyl-N-acetylglucosamine deacetylase, partial [Thermoanaerobaculia bacterium]|nr:UDP-3-O-acyl-N-acetylglucosamine deacetylase [Thermoanaerobaculia bacterium]
MRGSLSGPAAPARALSIPCQIRRIGRIGRMRKPLPVPLSRCPQNRTRTLHRTRAKRISLPFRATGRWHQPCKGPVAAMSRPARGTPYSPYSLFAQKTIARPVAISGVGIHTGRPGRVRLNPAPEGTGILFRRADSGVEIPALASEVSSVELATTLGRDDVTISTVEHLLAAVRVRDLDNLFIDLNAPEVPILDGSA